MFTELGRIIERWSNRIENESIDRAAPYTGTEDIPEVLVPMIPKVIVDELITDFECQIKLTERQR